MSAMGSRFLKSVAELPLPRRRAAEALEARRLAGTPELDRMLAELSAGDRYARLTAIRMAVVAGHRDHLLTQVDSVDPECGVRALAALTRIGVSPEEIVSRLPDLSQRARKAVVRVLRRGGRSELADALLAPMRARFGDAEAAGLLPNCSADPVARALPELAYALPSWGTLSRRHIGVLFDYVEAAALDAGRDEWRELWSRLTADVVVAARHDPGRLLTLAARAVEHVQLSVLHPVAGMLARHDPEAVRRLVLHPSGHGRGLGGPALWRAMRVLPDAELAELYLASAPHDRSRFLRTLPPSRRAVIATPQLMRLGLGPGEVDLPTLDALPAAVRATLARELLARPGGAEVPEIAERLSARLPWDEAKPILAEAIRRPTADERAIAYPLLVTAAVGSRDAAVVGELLDMLRRLRNEQDPVRRSALQAVATLPLSLLAAGHVPALEQLAVDALQARDRSYPTSAAIGDLARTLLIRGAQTGETAFTAAALRIAALLAESYSRLNLTGLHRNLPRGAEQWLFEALRSRLEADAARDRWTLALTLADGLERRAFGVLGLQRLVLRACGAADDSTARRAVRLALADPVTRDAHLDDMLRRDRSIITLWELRDLIATRRTDLLDDLLDGATSGRFLSKKVRFVPMFPVGIGSWTTHHIERYARLLDDYAQSSKSSVSERAGAIRQLGLLPGSFTRLLPYIELGDVVEAEAALTALGRSDEPERAIAVLAAHVGDDHARVAVSSIATCARSIPPARLGGALAPLLDSPKITAVKEGIRLLAVLRASDAMAVIRERGARAGVHRDIQRAMVFAAARMLDQDPAWAVLHEAVADPEVAGAVLEIAPRLLAVPDRERFAAFLRDLAAGSDHRVALQALDALTHWYRWSPPDTRDVLVARLTDLSQLGLWTSAVRALLVDAGATGHSGAVIAAVERLLAQTGDSFPERDLPARQRLSSLLHWLGPILGNNEHSRPIAAPVIALLAPDPLWHEQLIATTFAAVRWTEPERTIAALEALSPFAIGALTGDPSRRLAERFGAIPDEIPIAALQRIATGLAASASPAIALAAIELITKCGHKFGWTDPWSPLLADLRNHPDIDVRRAAHNTFTAPE
ncbi:hypothetical protein OHB26_25280 [Nocardia sp. NBC_01503]|uniref:hypothetical protein n=1 Tax=Nocardia sp. NBC_01503 TaxID=2975997 RepID=UPI002E7C5364|nr:hypothetical protein [Nocardia sp. NBC_01503]WTL30247.1 hypothetical protein OHB26_25280 [Nocardia sp. NBC_01503]